MSAVRVWPAILFMVGAMASLSTQDALAWLCMAGGLAGVACYTGFQTLTGILARRDSPQTIHLYTSAIGAIGAIVFSVMVPWFWPSTISVPELALLLAVAVAGTYGQYFMVMAFSQAPVSVLSPYLYSAIAFSVLLGWVLFGHVPDAASLAGMALIAGFGVLSAWTRPGTPPQ